MSKGSKSSSKHPLCQNSTWAGAWVVCHLFKIYLFIFCCVGSPFHISLVTQDCLKRFLRVTNWWLTPKQGYSDILICTSPIKLRSSCGRKDTLCISMSNDVKPTIHILPMYWQLPTENTKKYSIPWKRLIRSLVSSSSISLSEGCFRLESNITKLQLWELALLHLDLWDVFHWRNKKWGVLNRAKIAEIRTFQDLSMILYMSIWSIFFLNKTAILRGKKKLDSRIFRPPFAEPFCRSLSRKNKKSYFRKAFTKLSRTTFEALQRSSFIKSFTRGFWSILTWFS